MENVNVRWKINIHGVEDDGTEYDIDFPAAGFGSYDVTVEAFFKLAPIAIKDEAFQDRLAIYSVIEGTDEKYTVTGYVYWQFFFIDGNKPRFYSQKCHPTHGCMVPLDSWTIDQLREVHAAFCQPRSVQIGI